MSTRIYQGFRLKTNDLSEVLRIVNSFRPWVMEQANERIDTFMANMEKEGMEVGKAWRMWKDRRKAIRDTGHRDPFFDTDFSISLIPASEHLLGIVYTEHTAWFNAWVALPEVEEFGYWNNSDGPEEVSEEAWEARGKAWEVLKDGPVSLQSFSIDLVPDEGPWPKGLR